MYKINSELPLVWRTPTSLQIGIDHPRVVLPQLYPAEERFISALRAGFGDVSLTAIAAECGLTPPERDALLTALGTALIPTEPRQSWRIALDGSGPFVDSLGLLLIGTGHRVVRASASVAGSSDLAIVVGDYALQPHRPGAWLSRDVPHVPVVFSDESVRIGPLLGGKPADESSAEKFPCEQCIELAHRDMDDCWVAMASQLAGMPAPSQAPLLTAEVVALLSRWVNSPGSQPITSNTAIRIDAANGAREILTYALHPDCACQALPRNVSVLGSSHGQCLAVPKKARVASSRA
ncbi:MAG: hypothetical protein RI926_1044 [Actinomycetota bacterium]